MDNPKSEPCFPKPKILLVDLPATATEQLLKAGFNASSGSFGRPYKIPTNDGFLPVIAKANLPNHTEQEVILIDLKPPAPTDGPEGTKKVSASESDWYAKASRGFIDPRPRVMLSVREDWNRILSSGGTFVVFAQPRLRQNLVFASIQYGQLRPNHEINHDNWSFLSILSRENIKIEMDQGTESQLSDSADFLESFFRKHQTDLEFDSVLKPLSLISGRNAFDFIPLLRSKFGDCISGIAVAKNPPKGRILILPQVKDKSAAVYELVTTILPEISRHLFPYFEGDRWIHNVEYEHVTVLEKRRAQNAIKEDAAVKVAKLSKEIDSEQQRLRFIHGILTATGEPLVDDIKSVPSLIGLQQFNEPEEEAGQNKQEDIQIHDRSPVLLIEVKGLAGQPTEKDTLQVTKYVLRRVKEWNRVDVCGLFLVNHQRNLPALQRDHENAFTEQQLGDAIENGMGLMTTWDLFRLVRGMIDWKWPGKVVQDVFYGKGRLPRVPSHYELAGTVAHFYDEISILSIVVGKSGLRVGDTIGYLLPHGFFEERIESLQVEKRAVSEASPNQRAGYKTVLKRKDAPNGTQIYIVRSAT